MLHLYAGTLPVKPDTLKPALHTGEKAYSGAVARQRLLGKDKMPLRLAHHKVHIGKVRVHIVILCKEIGFAPEGLGVIAYRLYIALRLHIVGGKSLVKIVADGKHGLLARFAFNGVAVQNMPP